MNRVEIIDHPSPYGPITEIADDKLLGVLRRRLFNLQDRLRDDCRPFAAYLNEIVQAGALDRLHLTWEQFCERVMKMDVDRVGLMMLGVKALGFEVPDQAIPEPVAVATGAALTKYGTNQYTRGDSIRNSIKGGTNIVYTLARLRRDRPDLAAQVETGKLSANAAAIQAGFRKQATPLDQLRRAWKKASTEERDIFRSEL